MFNSSNDTLTKDNLVRMFKNMTMFSKLIKNVKAYFGGKSYATFSKPRTITTYELFIYTYIH